MLLGTSIVLFFLNISSYLLVALAAPSTLSILARDAVNGTQLEPSLNFTSITNGYCGKTACSSFLRPPLTDCNITTCACTDTVSNNLATCLQCGYDNTAGMTLASAQQYLTNFTSACTANGTSVETKTLTVNSATGAFGIPFKAQIAWWALMLIILVGSS
ncbi:hypothetical protein FB446DRAFT_738781 [Lentinula raphanica]|nr:hypothetical protein FB446DRAFT_738781 [Lentinula raphanica]